PREDERGHVDLAQLVEIVSADAGFATLTNEVIDSRFVVMRGFQQGRLTHDYVSDRAAVAEWLNDRRPANAPTVILLRRVRRAMNRRHSRRSELTRSTWIGSARRCAVTSAVVPLGMRSSSIG